MNLYRNAKPHPGNFDFEVDFHEANVEFLRDQHEELIREKLEAERQAILGEELFEHDKQIERLNFEHDYVDTDVSDEALESWGNFCE